MSARVYEDPFVNYLYNAFRSAVRVESIVRIDGQDIAMYDVMHNVVRHAGPPASSVASIVGKFFVNVAPATIDYVYMELKDANEVVIGVFEAQAVTDPIRVDAPGEYILNITISVSAPTSVAITVR